MTTPENLIVNGRRMRVRVEGDPAATPLILLHGIGRSLEDWSPQLVRLSKHYRVIALDLPGSGFSERLLGSTTLRGIAERVFDTLDTLNEYRAVHVVGNSLGGAVAQRMLVLKPERVASLTLVASAGFGAEVALLLRLLSVPVLGRVLTRRTTPAMARMIERGALADPKLVTPARIEHAVAIGREPHTGAVLHETARTLATIKGVRPEWRERLVKAVAQHERPVLLVWGDKDKVLPVQQLTSAAQAFPQARTVVMPGVGHMPQVERPDQFAELLADFLANTSGQTATLSAARRTKSRPRRRAAVRAAVESA